jgi:uncharacterized protein (DUF849 family)
VTVNVVRPLPSLMVAPNGARKQKKDVPGLPLSADEILTCVIECRQAGADGFHLHVREDNGEHSLDVCRYRDLLDRLYGAIPDGYFQVTTEAVGKYSPEQQRAVVLGLRPEAVSVAVRELFRDRAEDELNHAFLQDVCAGGGAVQFILYDNQDIERLARFIDDRIVAEESLQLLHVIGPYDFTRTNTVDGAAEIPRRLAMQRSHLPASADWAVCCFGQQETECLASVRRMGGKVRIGFENNVLNSNGSVARSNAERVHDLLTNLTPKEWAAWVGSMALMAL